ncbi:hypothetical protein CDL15_Pgr007561 [Punica granatum]|uniref:Uncharacterized protein n=1 Tax=Punica granatum TaxID=22663 RepID=A0A218X9A5_PUNGR|nr:hypothetical protein CDL15_Pgr007561 [Punica granatum]PKI41096.1 hypothetical protein CRG98_038624 [Punica granatum]
MCPTRLLFIIFLFLTGGTVHRLPLRDSTIFSVSNFPGRPRDHEIYHNGPVQLIPDLLLAGLQKHLFRLRRLYIRDSLEQGERRDGETLDYGGRAILPSIRGRSGETLSHDVLADGEAGLADDAE